MVLSKTQNHCLIDQRVSRAEMQVNITLTGLQKKKYMELPRRIKIMLKQTKLRTSNHLIAQQMVEGLRLRLRSQITQRMVTLL